MAALPSAIVFVNNDLTENVKAKLIRQLHITDVLDGYVFDDYIALDSGYADSVRAAKKRMMVIRSFEELENRTEADVVIFIKAGMADIEENKFGPPNTQLVLHRLTWGALGVF